MKIYNNAEIYLTRCTHPDYSFLRYLGLDTKCDPNYLGSSVVLKWWIRLLGRSYFSKVILDKTTGDMRECCHLEQQYILRYDCINNPNFLNMNGGKVRSNLEERVLSLETTRVLPVNKPTNDYLAGLCQSLSEGMNQFPDVVRQVTTKLLSMLVYGYMVYDQEDFEYNEYQSTGACSAEELNELLEAMVGLGYIDLVGGLIVITDQLIDSIPDDVNHLGFTTVSAFGLKE